MTAFVVHWSQELISRFIRIIDLVLSLTKLSPTAPPPAGTPLLNDLVSGANISFSPEISTICGLAQSDVLAALRVVCNNEEEVQKHLRELERHANGYHFCQEQSVDTVFNTQIALSYLEVSRPSFNTQTTLSYLQVEVPSNSSTNCWTYSQSSKEQEPKSMTPQTLRFLSTSYAFVPGRLLPWMIYKMHSKRTNMALTKRFHITKYSSASNYPN